MHRVSKQSNTSNLNLKVFAGDEVLGVNEAELRGDVEAELGVDPAKLVVGCRC